MVGDRAVIVDGNADSLAALRTALDNRGWDVRVTSTGEGAFSVVRSFDPSAVVVEIDLPDLDGYSVARVLRAGLLRDGAVIIGLAGSLGAETSERAADAGIDVMLSKPVSIATLCRHMTSGRWRASVGRNRGPGI